MPSGKRRRQGGRARRPPANAATSPPGVPAGAARPVIVDRRGQPLATWHWRTFPVYFALTGGILGGFFLGTALPPNHSRVGLAVYALVLFLFSLGLTRLSSRLAGQRILGRKHKQEHEA